MNIAVFDESPQFVAYRASIDKEDAEFEHRLTMIQPRVGSKSSLSWCGCASLRSIGWYRVGTFENQPPSISSFCMQVSK